MVIRDRWATSNQIMGDKELDGTREPKQSHQFDTAK